MFRKNVSGQFIHFQGMDATTGGIKSGVTWTVRRCIDGTFAAGGGTVTEDSTNGWYKYAMSQANTNGNDIAFNFTGTGAVPQTVNIVTTACDPTTATNFGITALPATACTTNASLITSGSGTDQLTVSGGLASSDAKKINAVSTSSVTTINANLGTTAAITFDANNLPKVDVEDWKATAVSGSVPPDALFIRNGTAQAGGATSITLDAGASATNSLYNNCVIFLRSGTGAGQVNIITAYVGATKVATVANTWATNPDSTSVFSILPIGPAETVNAVTVGTNNDKSGYSLTQAFPSNFSALGITAGGHISNVDTLTTYTGDTPQTGDVYALMHGATTEPASVPAATAGRHLKIDWLFTKTRNKSTQTASAQTILADDNSTTVATTGVSDDGTTFTKNKDGT